MDQFGPISEIENSDQTKAPKDNISTQLGSRQRELSNDISQAQIGAKIKKLCRLQVG